MYKYLFGTIKEIWQLYGGWKGLFKSPFFHLAVIVTLATYNFWIIAGWWEVVISIMPNLIGFSLGGYAILVAFGEPRFQNLISGSQGDEKSPYIKLSSNFIIFLSFQITSLILAILARGVYFPIAPWFELLLTKINLNAGTTIGCLRIIFWGISYFIFIYSITQTIAATLQIFRLTKWKDLYSGITNKQDDEQAN